MIDPSNDSISGIDTDSVESGSAKWSCSVLAPNGNVYGIPFYADNILVIDTMSSFTASTANYLSVYRNNSP